MNRINSYGWVLLILVLSGCVTPRQQLDSWYNSCVSASYGNQSQRDYCNEVYQTKAQQIAQDETAARAAWMQYQAQQAQIQAQNNAAQNQMMLQMMRPVNTQPSQQTTNCQPNIFGGGFNCTTQ